MIPKRIIQVYNSENLPVLFKISQKYILYNCKDFEYIFYTQESMDFFVKLNYPHYLELYNKLTLKNKISFFTLLEIYTNGGIYIDMDFILYKNFNELLNNDYDIIFPEANSERLGKYFFCSEKKHKFIYFLILKISQIFNTNNKIIIDDKLLYKLYIEYNKSIPIIKTDYTNCFGVFGFHIKINSFYFCNPKYPKWFLDTSYSIDKEDKVKSILRTDIRWLCNTTYHISL